MKIARRYRVDHTAGAYVSIFDTEIQNLSEDAILAIVREKATAAMKIVNIERLWIPDDTWTLVDTKEPTDEPS